MALGKIMDEIPSEKEVRLLSCNSDAAAKALSKYTDKAFYASDGVITIYENGKLVHKKPFRKYHKGARSDVGEIPPSTKKGDGIGLRLGITNTGNFNNFSTFIKKAGNDVDLRPYWATEKGYEELISLGKYTNDQIESFNALKNTDMALGLFEPKFNGKRLKTLEEWSKTKGDFSYYQNMEKRGFFNSKVPLSMDIAPKYQILQAIIRSRKKGGKIHFRLDGMDRKIIKLEIGKDPTKLGRKYEYTLFELKNIVRNEDWLNNAVFYKGDVIFTIQNDAKELMKKYGIQFIK